MLGFLFGFNARIGRLRFLFSTIVVTVMMVAIYIAAITYAFQTAPKGTVPSPTSGPIFAAAILYAWLTVTLQSMRFRDIGWDPVCVLPAWIAIVIVDGLVATKFPAMSLGHERGTHLRRSRQPLAHSRPACFAAMRAAQRQSGALTSGECRSSARLDPPPHRPWMKVSSSSRSDTNVTACQLSREFRPPRGFPVGHSGFVLYLITVRRMASPRWRLQRQRFDPKDVWDQPKDAVAEKIFVVADTLSLSAD